MWLVYTDNYKNNERRKPKTLSYYCPVCGFLSRADNHDANAILDHAFTHPLNEWQTAYDAEDFVTDFLTPGEFYRMYDIQSLETRKVLLQVGDRAGVDLKGREGSGKGTRETAVALLTRANEVLGLEYVQDFTDKEGYSRRLRDRLRARVRVNNRTRAKNRLEVNEGGFTFEFNRYLRPTRDVREVGLVKDGGVVRGQFWLDIPYRKKSLIKIANGLGQRIPSTVVIDRFEILPEFRRKGLGRSCYRGLEKIIRERYDPDEITLKVAIWNPRPFWEKMGYSATGKSGNLEIMKKKFDKPAL